MNVVVLQGTLSSPPQERALQSGDRLLVYEVTTREVDLPAHTVPVVWFDAPAGADGFDAGDEVVVVGRVRRRFYRAGERTQSSTEVVADEVVGVRAKRRVRTALGRAAARLGGEEVA
jgi:single-strand DNA-binding protein